MRVRIRQERLRELLAGSNRSQNAWALRIGLSRGHWSDLVNGKHPYPSAKTRAAMLEAFGVDPHDLFEIEAGPAEATEAGFEAAIRERYLVDREVGEGGMGRVLLARDARFGRNVAVKVVSEEALSDLGAERFLTEIRRSARLAHPNILPVLDAGEAGGRAYLVTLYVEGGSLRDRLDAQGRLPLRETLAVARGVAAALTEAHRHGLLHGDVKPENVLLVDDHPYLTDFGLARAIHLEAVREWERRPEIDVAAGTPAYVSPEQARGSAGLDPRSDVYSLACMIFEMLAGRPPFTGATTTEVVRRRFEAIPPDLAPLAPETPRSVARVLAAAMALDPGDRPATPADLVARLESAAVLESAASTADTGPMGNVLGAFGRWALTRPSRPSGAFMNSLLDDLRYTVRSLRHRPLFALVAVITLMIGIGANAAIFSVIDAVVLSPLPFEEPDRLLRIYSTYEGRLCCTISPPNFLDMRQESRQLELAGYTGSAYSVTGGGEPVRLPGYRVTAGFFELLGTEPGIGRFFTAEDESFGSERVVVLSDRLWRGRFDADPGALGTPITIDGEPYVIVGVTRPGFRLTGQPALYTPFAWDPENMPGRGNNLLTVLGRLADDSTTDAAMGELESIYGRLVEAFPDNITNKGVGQLPLEEWLVGNGRKAQLLVLWGAVGMVLLVACVNVMNLMLARAEARQRELAIRAALGAGRGRLLRHFLTESLLIATVGGGLGVLAGHLGLRALLGAFGGAVPRGDEVALSGTVLTFALGVSLLTGLIVGIVPTIQPMFARGGAVLQEGGRGSTDAGNRLRWTLVVLEVAAALVLVIGAGLMLKSFWRLSRVDVGVDAARLLTVRVTPPEGAYPDTATVLEFYERLRGDVARLPRVESAGVTSAAPFSGTWTNYSVVNPVGQPDLQASFVEARAADGAYFETLTLDVVRGRDFDGSESADGPPTVIVNEELVRQLFPDVDPIGAQIQPGPTSTAWTIVGVVENLRDHGPDRAIPPTVWFPITQGWWRSLSLVVRTEGDPLDVVPAVRGIVRDIDPQLPVYEISRLDQLIRDGLGNRRFAMTLLGLFAGIGLALGAVGIYGVMAYTVERRTREIGLRQALGATRGSVLQLVVGQGTRLALVGVVVGSIGAYLLRESLGGLLYEVEGFDLATYSAVAVTLVLVAMLACFLPARRAAAVDPMEALRDD